MHTPDLLPAEGLGVYWLVDVLVEDRVVGVVKVVKDTVVKDRSEEEEVVIATGLPMPGSVVYGLARPIGSRVTPSDLGAKM